MCFRRQFCPRTGRVFFTSTKKSLSSRPGSELGEPTENVPNRKGHSDKSKTKTTLYSSDTKGLDPVFVYPIYTVGADISLATIFTTCPRPISVAISTRPE